jgi:hypothetical protein
VYAPEGARLEEDVERLIALAGTGMADMFGFMPASVFGVRVSDQISVND